ncbi:MAG TPA: hypothetical protein VGZ71_15475, partial [Puia sp.]|nr:hypothetical protein [Puia sp.]
KQLLICARWDMYRPFRSRECLSFWLRVAVTLPIPNNHSIHVTYSHGERSKANGDIIGMESL